MAFKLSAATITCDADVHCNLSHLSLDDLCIYYIKKKAHLVSVKGTVYCTNGVTIKAILQSSEAITKKNQLKVHLLAFSGLSTTSHGLQQKFHTTSLSRDYSWAISICWWRLWDVVESSRKYIIKKILSYFTVFQVHDWTFTCSLLMALTAITSWVLLVTAEDKHHYQVL